MLNNLPKDILEYLITELPPFTGVLIIRSDSDGNIIDYHGPHKDYLRLVPETGKPIHDYVPALFSMVPPLISPMVLNNIQTNTNIYADIHIVEAIDNEYWVFFVDQSNQVEGIRDILQKMNEEKFQKESNIKLSSVPDIYDVFEDLILSIKDSETAKITSKIPQWFSHLNQNYYSGSTIKFTDVFPYLEVFIFEATDFWENNQAQKLESGIWTESLSNGKEIALTAFAICNNDQKYLLIRPMEDNIDKEQMALQMAREQKLAYEKLEKTERKLQTLLEYKDKFVSIVSHDLRSPVAAVLGISELLVNDKNELNKLDEFYQEMIYNIRDEMIRLLDYNDKLYHWSNLELGNFKIVKEKSSLIKLIKAAERTSETKFKSKNISFSTNIDNDIYVEIDTTLFLQVLNNLVSNAVKFTPEAGEIAINVFNNIDSIQIIISDSGVGMPKNISDNIFSGFARNSTMGTSGEKGTGLGLGIVKKIIDAHGFNISVESEVGSGSQFIISIPK